jgi:hypothetical protein
VVDDVTAGEVVGVGLVDGVGVTDEDPVVEGVTELDVVAVGDAVGETVSVGEVLGDGVVVAVDVSDGEVVAVGDADTDEVADMLSHTFDQYVPQFSHGVLYIPDRHRCVSTHHPQPATCVHVSHSVMAEHSPQQPASTMELGHTGTSGLALLTTSIDRHRLLDSHHAHSDAAAHSPHDSSVGHSASHVKPSINTPLEASSALKGTKPISPVCRLWLPILNSSMPTTELYCSTMEKSEIGNGPSTIPSVLALGHVQKKLPDSPRASHE